MNWMSIAFRYLGPSTALMIGPIIYLIFRGVDKKASGPAKTAINSFVRGYSNNQVDTSFSVGSVFQYIYGSRLLSGKTFCKSLLYSLCCFFLYGFYVQGVHALELYNFMLKGIDVGLVGSPQNPLLGIVLNRSRIMPIYYLRDYLFWSMGANAASDYLSLFVIKQALRPVTHNLPIKLLFAFLSSTFFIILFYCIFIFIFGTNMEISLASTLRVPLFLKPISLRAPLEMLVLFTLPPAIIVNTWLILFLFGALLNKFIFRFFQSVVFVQWFIKRGKDHPYEAIGISAGIGISALTLLIFALRYSIA